MKDSPWRGPHWNPAPSLNREFAPKRPSKTPRQRRTMSAAAHSPKFAKKLGIPVAVAKEFNRADQKTKKK